MFVEESFARTEPYASAPTYVNYLSTTRPSDVEAACTRRELPRGRGAEGTGRCHECVPPQPQHLAGSSHLNDRRRDDTAGCVPARRRFPVHHAPDRRTHGTPRPLSTLPSDATLDQLCAALEADSAVVVEDMADERLLDDAWSRAVLRGPGLRPERLRRPAHPAGQRAHGPSAALRGAHHPSPLPRRGGAAPAPDDAPVSSAPTSSSAGPISSSRSPRRRRSGRARPRRSSTATTTSTTPSTPDRSASCASSTPSPTSPPRTARRTSSRAAYLFDDEHPPRREDAVQAEMRLVGAALVYLGSAYHGGGVNRTVADAWYGIAVLTLPRLTCASRRTSTLPLPRGLPRRLSPAAGGTARLGHSPALQATSTSVTRSRHRRAHK